MYTITLTICSHELKISSQTLFSRNIIQLLSASGEGGLLRRRRSGFYPIALLFQMWCQLGVFRFKLGSGRWWWWRQGFGTSVEKRERDASKVALRIRSLMMAHHRPPRTRAQCLHKAPTTGFAFAAFREVSIAIGAREWPEWYWLIWCNGMWTCCQLFSQCASFSDKLLSDVFWILTVFLSYPFLTEPAN